MACVTTTGQDRSDVFFEEFHPFSRIWGCSLRPRHGCENANKPYPDQFWARRLHAAIVLNRLAGEQLSLISRRALAPVCAGTRLPTGASALRLMAPLRSRLGLRLGETRPRFRPRQ